jgi:hypothetical protein
LAPRLLVVYVATPLLLSWPVPRVVVPLRNVTDPEGAVVPALWATVAVKVTLEPTLDCVDEGVAAMLMEVVVAVRSEVTVSVAGDEVEAA